MRSDVPVTGRQLEALRSALRHLHAQAGAQMAYEFMKNQGLSEALCYEAAELIRLHADKSRLTSSGNPLLLQLLMEADHQDESGAMSIVWDAMASAVRPEQDEIGRASCRERV